MTSSFLTISLELVAHESVTPVAIKNETLLPLKHPVRLNFGCDRSAAGLKVGAKRNKKTHI